MSKVVAEPIHLATERNHQNCQNHLLVERIHLVAVRIHTVAAMDHPTVHPMAVAAAEMAVAEEIGIHTKELMQRNPRWAA